MVQYKMNTYYYILSLLIKMLKYYLDFFELVLYLHMFLQHSIVHLYFFNSVLLNLLIEVNLYMNLVHILFVHHLQTFFILIFMPYILIFLSLLFFLIHLFYCRFFIQLIHELHMYLSELYLHQIFKFMNIFDLKLI